MLTDKLPFQATTFIGRTEELIKIDTVLSDPACRLLTLVGLGGIGKTRLALEVARQLPTDSVHFVDLQPLTSPDFLVTAIAEALGFQFYRGDDPKQQLLDYLCEQTWLLVLDNFEHLLDGAPLLSEILATAPALRLLVTSRERLNLIEEWVLDVGGLAYPDFDRESDLLDYSAVRLFVQHARRASVGFMLTNANRLAVIRICRLVDGMPLGIELAASRVRVLSCEAIADEIERSLDILETHARNVEPRHRTMRAAFEPTWNRLSDDERDVFMRLSVFRGGFTREAVEAMAGASLGTLSALVDKSLLRVDTNGRYDLHELMRQYAEEKLRLSIAIEPTYDTHCLYYADFLDLRVEDLKGRRQIEALKEIRADFENVRVAWGWAAEHQYAQNIEKMLESLWLFCDLCNREQEGWELFRAAEHSFSGEKRFERLWGRLIARSGGVSETSQREIQTALQIAVTTGDPAEIAVCLQRLSDICISQGHQAEAQQLLKQRLDHYRHLGDTYYEAKTLFMLMNTLMTSNYPGMYDDFIRLGGESLKLRREIGDHVGIAWSIAPVAHGATRVGHFAEAEQLWRERIALGKEVGARTLVALGYAHSSYAVYFIQGDFARARMAGEEAVRIGIAVDASNPIAFGRTTLGLLASMGENYLEGKALCQQAGLTTAFGWINGMAAWGSTIAACGLEDYELAAEFFPTATEHLVHMFAHIGTICCLPAAAILLAQAGEQVRAVELLALAFTQPGGASGWIEKWPLLMRLRAALEQALGWSVYSASWERGRLLDVDKVAAELLQFQGKPVRSQAGSPPLPNAMLSERELEVLRLIELGLTNQEIADRLYVGVSTVKKHINHIYDKLDAKNRTQAVAIARERRMLPR